MIIAAFILFAVAALFGSIILFAILKNKPTPGPVVILHGLVALFALLALIAYTVGHGNILLVISIGLFVLAALGGLTMLSIDLRGKPIPKFIALIHPLVAVSGFVVLLVYVYRTFLS